MLRKIGGLALAVAALFSLAVGQKLMNPQAEAQAKANAKARLAAVGKMASAAPKRLKPKLAKAARVAATKTSSVAKTPKGAHKLTNTAVSDQDKAIPYFVGLKLHDVATGIAFKETEGARKSLKVVANIYEGSKIGERLNTLYEGLGKASPDWKECDSQLSEIIGTFAGAYQAKSPFEGFGFSTGFAVGQISFGLVLLSDAELAKRGSETIADSQATLKKDLDKGVEGMNDDVKAAVQAVISASPSDSKAVTDAVNKLNAVYGKMLQS